MADDRAAAMELVVAVAENDVIGRGNALPWRLPADLRHFKGLTIGGTVLMGRRTYESIGKALPQRKNLVLSRSAEFAPSDCTKVASLDEARSATDGPVLMIIGGAEVFKLCLPLARPGMARVVARIPRSGRRELPRFQLHHAGSRRRPERRPERRLERRQPCLDLTLRALEIHIRQSGGTYAQFG